MKSNDSFVHNLRSDFHMTQRTLAPVRFSDGLTGPSLPSSPFSAFNSNEDKLTDFPIGGITTPCRLLLHHSRESSVARSPRSRLAKTAAPARDFPLPLEAGLYTIRRLLLGPSMVPCATAGCQIFLGPTPLQARGVRNALCSDVNILAFFASSKHFPRASMVTPD